MKTEAGEPTNFAPVTITLETAEEMYMMRASLTMSTAKLREASPDVVSRVRNPGAVEQRMWQSFVAVYREIME